MIRLKPGEELATLIGSTVVEEIYLGVDQPEEFIAMLNGRLTT